jgi:hypothetical protein
VSVLDLSEVLDSFETDSPVEAFTVTGSRQSDGTWNGWATDPEPIQAVVLQATPQQLEILSKGEISDGGLVIQTDEKLWFNTDLNSGLQAQQSFVKYQDMTFRIIGTGFMKALSNVHLYYATMFQEFGVEALTTTSSTTTTTTGA